jgi:hypothetical protein
MVPATELPPDDPWSVYARLVVEIDAGDDVEGSVRGDERGDGPIVIRAAPVGQLGSWPFSSLEPVHVLTAWNPGTARPGSETNRREQARLEDELRPLASALWAAHGTDPASGAGDEGVAVQGLAEETVRALGARYGQDAIFSWSPSAWAIVSCRGARREVAGWVLGHARPRA